MDTGEQRHGGEGSVMVEAEMGVTGLYTKENPRCWQTSEAERGQGRVLPETLPREQGRADPLI